METPTAIAENKIRLSVLLDAIRLQCSAPGLMEPYPLYMADRMVKHLGCVLPVPRRATTQEMATNGATAASHDAVERRKRIFQAMHASSTQPL